MLVYEMETIEKIKLIKGKVRGVGLQTDRQFIMRYKGENGVILVEDEMKKMVFSFKYDNIKSTSEFFPIYLRIASLMAIKKIFHLDDAKVKEMGCLATKNSIFTKLVLRYLINLEKMAKEISGHWRRHYTVGYMDPGKLHEEDKYLVVRLRDFITHPIMCTYLSGYILGDVDLCGDFENITIDEVKCMHRGDPYHEFIVKRV